MDKMVKEILDNLKPGLRPQATGSGHYRIVSANGVVIRQEGGLPITVPSTPSVTERGNIIASLRRAGVYQDERQIIVKAHNPLIRDDVAESSDENNHATNTIRGLLKGFGVYTWLEQHKQDMATIISYIDLRSMECSIKTVDKLYKGEVLTQEELKPMQVLIAELEREEDPIASLFRLLRKAKDLPDVPEEEEVETPLGDEPELSHFKIEQEEKEEVVSAIEMPATVLMGTTDEMVRAFILDLREKEEELVAEAAKVRDLIDQMEEMFPAAKLDDDENDEPNKQPQRAKTESKVTRIGPENGQQRNPTGAAARPRDQYGLIEGSKQSALAAKIMEVMDQGGEYTQGEFIETFEESQGVVSTVVRKLEEGGFIIQTGGKLGSTSDPKRYGASSIYS